MPVDETAPQAAPTVQRLEPTTTAGGWFEGETWPSFWPYPFGNRTRWPDEEDGD